MSQPSSEASVIFCISLKPITFPETGTLLSPGIKSIFLKLISEYIFTKSSIFFLMSNSDWSVILFFLNILIFDSEKY